MTKHKIITNIRIVNSTQYFLQIMDNIKLGALNIHLFPRVTQPEHHLSAPRHPGKPQTSFFSGFEVLGGTNNIPKTREPEIKK